MQEKEAFKHPRRVFVTNWGYHDYKNAERFGQLIPLTQARIDLIHTDRLEAEVQIKLEEHDFDAEHDYILISGSPVLSLLIGGYLARNFEEVTVLYWEALHQDYLERKVTFTRKGPNAGPGT